MNWGPPVEHRWWDGPVLLSVMLATAAEAVRSIPPPYMRVTHYQCDYGTPGACWTLYPIP